ncbi:hypothetical protein SKAU_G00146800 [Synaphobranchus kaupii]|uniref:Uncharacterized protein n=1 Tax=Synaphobranchus kaupii TaxID=118154 RepID=A0A9Q1FTP9_SYNKA|nr:hypothetical protein SKAU_G00146800 [Synaphobranchus kaupii]
MIHAPTEARRGRRRMENSRLYRAHLGNSSTSNNAGVGGKMALSLRCEWEGCLAAGGGGSGFTDQSSEAKCVSSGQSYLLQEGINEARKDTLTKLFSSASFCSTTASAPAGGCVLGVFFAAWHRLPPQLRRCIGPLSPRQLSPSRRRMAPDTSKEEGVARRPVRGVNCQTGRYLRP